MTAAVGSKKNQTVEQRPEHVPGAAYVNIGVTMEYWSGHQYRAMVSIAPVSYMLVTVC